MDNLKEQCLLFWMQNRLKDEFIIKVKLQTAALTA